MAIADELRSFLESRLEAFDPTIDLSPNSRAQVQIIDSTVSRFAEDPFSTDIPTFIKDRMLQEYPDLASDDGGLLEDILCKPLRMLLAPFKREVESTKLNQSIRNASLMSEEEANALGANWFETRNEGNTAGGGTRLFFAAPVTARVTTDKRLFTNSGLSFFPTQNYFITSAQMLFNRQGSFYYLDIIVQAESPGEEYNVKKGEIVGIEDVPGVVKVANLSDFTDGAPRETNEEFLARIPQSLTERSFVTKRGVLAQTPNLFSSVRALQVIGAGEEGMNRDILTGTGEGFLHLAGAATIYGDWLWASSVVFRDDGPDNSILPQPSDTIRFHPGSPAPSSTVVVEATIIAILSATDGKYLFLLDQSPYGPSTSTDGSFALFKKGYITISNVPGGITSELTVPDDTVHLGGHTDVFVRPTSDVELQTTLQSVTDESPLVAIVDLTIPTANQNRVQSSGSDFPALGVEIGDVLVIETGSGFAGTYRILEVEQSPNQNYLRVDSLFSSVTAPGQELRARIVRSIQVDLVAPRVPKLPFTPGPVSDLQTNVGSTEFRFDTINIQEFGAKVGDVINVLDGPDAGEFVIVSFNPAPGGGVFVDRAPSATGANLSYEVYTKQNGLTFPLVRLKSLEVLDSTGQGTGITVPYGDAVEVRSTCDLEGAGEELITYDKQLIVFPDMGDIWGTAAGGATLADDSIAAVDIDDTTDARYTQNLEIADGVVRTLTADGSNQIVDIEVNLPPFLWNGKRDKLVALVTRKDPNFPSSVDGDHRTSDLAESKIGDSLTIYDGPNQGRYIIKDLRVLELWGATDEGHRRVALIQVDPPLKVDPIRTALNFIEDVSGPIWTAENYVDWIQYLTDWDNASGFYTAFLTQLRTSLLAENVNFASVAALKTFFDPLIRSSYSVGPSAKGHFRLYFLDPVSAEFYYGDTPTTFVSATDATKVFRIDPTLEPAQILPDSTEETPPSEWNRNLSIPADQSEYAYVVSGTSLPKRGIREGDLLEIYPAINDLPARAEMQSSWLCVTQTGSNVVQLILPPSSQLGNYTTVVPGQLLFIDSGPDIGAYAITKVVEQNWGATPPVIKVQIEEALTHTTENFPVSANLDFAGEVGAVLLTGVLTFPLTTINTTTLGVDLSTDGGATFPTHRLHTFASASYANVAALVAEITSAATLTSGGLLVAFDAGGGRLGIRATNLGPESWIQIGATDNTGGTAAINNGLSFSLNQTSQGLTGAVALGGTNRIHSTSLVSVVAGQYITVYAASNPNAGDDDSIISDGQDEAYLGTFLASGSAAVETTGEQTGQYYVDLERSATFPVDVRAALRYVVHTGTPETEPSNTSDGGKEISDQFVRFRLYDNVIRKRTVVGSPWTTFVSSHPLEDDSEEQVELNEALIDTAEGEDYYSHMSPYRILRPGVIRASATSMASNREGALYFFDLPVIGYGPGPEMNVTPLEGFTVEGKRKILGYTLQVEDENFAYSTKEEVNIILPNYVLPVGSTPELENEFSLAGQNIQVTYNNAPLVEDLQALYDSPLDRVTAANMLVRHFLPAYVMVDVEYVGGASVDEVAVDVIKYINNIDPDTAEIRSDSITKIIDRKGATKVIQPITVIALFHGTDRRIRGMRSENAIGSDDLPFFKGTFNQAFFIAGPDTSQEATRPSGEQVFLRRI